MSLRLAKRNDNWKKVFSRAYLNRYEQLGYSNLFCLGTGTVKFEGGITAIVGGNGVGKSTLASALGELIENTLEEEFLSKRAQLTGSNLHGVLREGAEERNRHAQGGSPHPRLVTGDDLVTDSWWLDPSYWGLHTRRQVLRDPNFLDLIEPVTPASLNEGDLKTISFVVGKKYDACYVYEISDYADFLRFPYFRVRSDGAEYGSEHMGQGELSLMMTLWVLRDLRPNSILILEEPEAHVSPRSQYALMDALAEAVSSKGIWTIVTTHSPAIVSRIPSDHVRLLARSNGAVTIFDRARRHQIAAILGGSGGICGVALVEDDVAKEFLISLLDEISPDLLRQLEVVSVAGEAKISAVLSAFPRTGEWFHLMGVYDGDQRGRVDASSHHWPHAFLPGATDPAVVLRSALGGSAGIAAFSAELRRAEVDIIAALDAVVGLDPKDWLIELSRQIIAPRQELVRALVRIWLLTSENSASATAFVESVVNCYNSSTLVTRQ